MTHYFGVAHNPVTRKFIVVGLYPSPEMCGHTLVAQIEDKEDFIYVAIFEHLREKAKIEATLNSWFESIGLSQTARINAINDTVTVLMDIMRRDIQKSEEKEMAYKWN